MKPLVVLWCAVVAVAAGERELVLAERDARGARLRWMQDRD